MSTLKNVITAAVVALVVAVLVAVGFTSSNESSAPVATTEAFGSLDGATVLEAPQVFKAGSSNGSQHLTIDKSGEIGPKSNQASWRNTTGRNVFVERTQIGFLTGTASSTYRLYVATSSSATLSSDYNRPGGSQILDGISFATSTIGPTFFTSTTTASRTGVLVQPNEYLVFQVQQPGPACNGATCETSTSTNRGISKFLWYFRGNFIP